MACPPGTIIFLNGVSSSGKTSLLHALQDELENPALEAGIDKFIFMLPRRYLERPLWDDVLGLASQAGQTGHSLVNGMHRAILALALAGMNVLADHVLVEPAWVEDCASLFADLPAYLVGLDCPLEVLLARESARKDRTLGQAARQFPLIHAHACYDLRVDTARHSPPECARQICRHLRANPPHAFRQLAGRSANPEL